MTPARWVNTREENTMDEKQTGAQGTPQLTREQMLADAEELLAEFALDYERMAR